MPPPDFWSRLREARLARIVLVYLAGAWGVLQFTSLLREELDLPRWLTPSVLVILLVGLSVVLIAAWAHARLSRTVASEPVPGARDVGHGEPATAADRAQTVEDAGARRARLLGSRSRTATLVVSATLAVAVLLGAARVVLWVRERGEPLGPGEAVAEAALPGVAVLPFSVRGEGLDVWREGMVDLVSTNLDQVAGLRAIDSRTVLARWREQIGNKGTPDLKTSLGVARSTRARYALVGSAVSIGKDVRLTADLYQLDPVAAEDAEAKSVWQGQVEGAPDSVLALVDELSIRILGALLERKGSETPSLSLESITTRSVPALKAYLQGEALLRSSDFRLAIPPFERAVAEDSTFALAYYRLATAQGWIEGLGGEGLANMTRAARLASRLPEREAMLVRAGLALERSTLDGVDSLKQAVRRYPDDAEAWYLLGDTYFHMGDIALIDRAQADQAFERALALDPTFAPAYIHLMDDGFLRPDSAQLNSALARYERLLPAGSQGRSRLALYHWVGSIAFGDSATREKAFESLKAVDAVPSQAVHAARTALSHPRLLAVQERLMNGLRKRKDPAVRDEATEALFFNYLNRGKVRAMYALLDDPTSPSFFPKMAPAVLYLASSLGLPVPPERYATKLKVPSAETPLTDFWGSGLDAFYAGAFSADQKRWTDVDAAVLRMRAFAGDFLSRGDSTTARFAEGAARALEGYELWKRGEGSEAVPVLQSAQRQATPFERGDLNFTIRAWLGGLLLELGRPQEAEPYYRSLSDAVFAYYKLGQIYEGLGKNVEAREAYQTFVLATQDADPELQPRVEEARSAVSRLTSVIRE
jgi:tetratricopeptide (TPR) repeat protein